MQYLYGDKRVIDKSYDNLKYTEFGDKLDRKRHIEPLTRRLSNVIDNNFVMTVSSQYGEEKHFSFNCGKNIQKKTTVG